MKIVVVHGDKGGVGKSTALMWMIENHLMNNRGDFGVIEADPKITDVGQRYESLNIVEYAPLEIENERDSMEGVGRIFEAAMKLEKDVIYVNMPASASRVLDPNAELLASSISDINASLRIVFVANNQAISKKLLENSMTNGIMKYANKTALVLNKKSDGDPQTWPVAMSDISPEKLVMMPEISAVSYRHVADVTDPLCVVMNDLNALQKNIIKMWIRNADDLSSYITE